LFAWRPSLPWDELATPVLGTPGFRPVSEG
jgi:hypothetical protein